jgi:hypothetical protein
MSAVLSLLVLFARPALADDVSILAMDDFGGESTETVGSDDYVVAGYQEMVKELGATIANKPMAPGETLGVSGFNVGFSTTFSFIRTGTIDGTNPAGWDLAAADEKPSTYLYVPWVTVRKGLPLSLEVGANAGWIGSTHTGVFGAWGRWGIVEGYRQLPDLSIQVGYAGYVGNDELELGVMDMSATLGYTLPFGATKGIHQASFAPYVSIGQTRIHAAPRLDLSRTGLEDRITEVSGFKKGDGFDKSFAPLQIGGGFRIVSGEFTLTIASTYVPSVVPTLSMGFGFTY